ncbi:hypothetical protein C356_04608 [Cryptococcus neoformans c45]|nr:hypothetical protein C356_04608 [Cryptococcus neoformans var. grubii c45]
MGRRVGQVVTWREVDHDSKSLVHHIMWKRVPKVFNSWWYGFLAIG